MSDIVGFLRKLQISRTTKSLELCSLGLSAFPMELLNAGHLRRLKFENNALVELPPGFSRLSNLVELSVADNRLGGLNSELEDFGILQVIAWPASSKCCVISFSLRSILC